MPKETPITLTSEFSGNFFTKSPVEGLTHNLYQYPARFSPLFAKTVIENFSKPGNLILDPFMGSGTTLIEAMVAGRKCIGTDINPIAALLSKTKTTLFTEKDLNIVVNWLGRSKQILNLQTPLKSNNSYWAENGYQRNIPWRIRKIVALILETIPNRYNKKLSDLIRCVLLSTTKTALESPNIFSRPSQFMELFESTFFSVVDQCRKFSSVVSASSSKNISILNLDANSLKSEHILNTGSKKVDLIITSPPYPGVHILYHRWQIEGSKETPALFWIAGASDGQGDAFYTLGGRTKKGIESYFKKIESIYSNVKSFLSDDALVFQMVAFSNIEEQLPLFNRAMEKAGYKEVQIYCPPTKDVSRSNYGQYLTRRVPLRKWYADMKGKTDSSLEFLLVHKKK